jgi:hypothetical protein
MLLFGCFALSFALYLSVHFWDHALRFVSTSPRNPIFQEEPLPAPANGTSAPLKKRARKPEKSSKGQAFVELLLLVPLFIGLLSLAIAAGHALEERARIKEVEIPGQKNPQPTP